MSRTGKDNSSSDDEDDDDDEEWYDIKWGCLYGNTIVWQYDIVGQAHHPV